MRRILIFYILLIIALINCPISEAADQNFRFEPLPATLPDPLPVELSINGKTLENGLPLIAVVEDPNPSTLRRIPKPDYMDDGLRAPTASFSITYVPNGGQDIWSEPCYTFPETAKTAFDAAADIWANTVGSGVTITIRACWADLGSSSILGYSGGGPLHRDFTGATRANTWYSGSLANSLNGSDLSSTEFDMHITYNTNFSWYYGTDGNTPSNQMDLMTVVLHEICHGLNFSGSMTYNSGSGSWGYGTGYPNIYDVFMRDGTGNDLINTSIYPNPSTALGTVLTSNNIWFHGTNAMAANGSQRVKMYAPSTWAGGSSYSHLDYNTFNDTPNQLMVYAVSNGESVHDPGAITRGLLKDLGWTVGAAPITADSTWLGNTTAWDSTGNWSQNALPDSSTSILIPTSPSGGNNFPVVDCPDAVCESVIVQGGSVTVQPGGLLTIGGVTIPENSSDAVFYNNLICGSTPFTATLTLDGTPMSAISSNYSSCNPFDFNTSLSWSLYADAGACGTLSGSSSNTLDCNCLYEFFLGLDASYNPTLYIYSTCPGDCSDVDSLYFDDIKQLENEIQLDHSGDFK